MRWVQKRISFSSTAKWAAQRPNSKSFSRGLRSLLILLHGIAHRLLGEAVLELEGEDGKAVDEESDVECALGAVPAVAELTDNGETILPEALLCLLVLGRGVP